MTPQDAIDHATPYIEASLKRSNPDGDTLDDVFGAVFGEVARLWTGMDSAAVTALIQTAKFTGEEIVWHAGGDMRNLMELLHHAAEALSEAGCDRIIVEETRPGWARALKAHGFREVTVLVKEL